jgi:hypothetical protein
MDAQQVITLGIVAVAAGSLGRRLWREWRGKGGGACAGCGGACGKEQRPANVRPAPQAKPLVTLSIGGAPPRRPTPPRPGA